MGTDFNVNQLYYQMLSVITPFYKGSWSIVKTVAEESLAVDLALLQEVGTLLAAGEIDKDFALAQVKKIPLFLEAQLITFAIIGESAAQQAANAVLDLLTGVITNLLPKPAVTPNA